MAGMTTGGRPEQGLVEALERIEGPPGTALCRCCRQGDEAGSTHADCPCFVAAAALATYRAAVAARRPLREEEKAVLYHGRCPACDDFPTGEWSDGFEFTAGCCGVELVAILCDGKDGAEHWRFQRAFVDDESDDTEPAGPPPGHPTGAGE